MFLSTSIRPFTQNENADNTGFKKPGALKSTGSSLRTPFKDRSVNSVSPTSKYNSKLQMQKKQEEPVLKKTIKNEIKTDVQMDEDDFYWNDYATFKEIEDEYGDVYPLKKFDVLKFLNDYVSRDSPKYIPDENDGLDEVVELPVPKFELRCSPLPAPFDVLDVPMPIFNF